MILIKPTTEIMHISTEALRLIEAAGRTCYKSEEKITEDSAPAFIARILRLGHESVIEHATATVRFVCDRGVSHEVVRHRIASYSQESTRYCDYGKMGIKFIIPGDFDLDEDDLALLTAIETHYNKCLANGRSPQQARYFLPNGLKTELVMTANFRSWRNFFNLRTASGAHPMMREIVIPLLAEFKSRIPVIFDDL